jgi:hypothetical protein
MALRLEGGEIRPLTQLSNSRAVATGREHRSARPETFGVQCYGMDPVTAWTIARTAGEISKKLYELGKNLKDREAKQQVDDVIDKLRELKQSASELEDENRELREKLRFKSEEYGFTNPFYFQKLLPKQPLCPKCFATNVAAPMSDTFRASGLYRRCLVCGSVFDSYSWQ